jgi:hypothetical protein
VTVDLDDEVIGTLSDGGQRSADTFGGLLPCGVVTSTEETAVVALALEHHTDGFAIALLIMSGAPGQLAWIATEGLSVVDDLGKAYPVQLVTQHAGLGTLGATVWIDAAIPPQARSLRLSISDVQRVAGARAGAGGLRTLSGGPWQIELPLIPQRTITEPPPMGAVVHEPLASRRIPSRSWSALRSVVPVGQSRVRDGVSLSLWALERYDELDILTLSLLVDAPFTPTMPESMDGHIAIWDDLGHQYSCTVVGGATGARWAEAVVEITPPINDSATRLGIEIGAIPVADSDGVPLATEPMTFGVTLPVSQ